jgi:hypothetical protein
MRGAPLLLFGVALALLASADGNAGILVASCSTPAALGCPTGRSWVEPAAAVNVQVSRGTTAPFVALSSVLPTERIAACYDDPALVTGSTGNCTTRVPGRQDLWQLKSVLYPAVPPPSSAGTLTLTVDSANPTWDSAAPLGSNLLSDLYVRLYGAPEGEPLVLLDAQPWAARSATFKRQSNSTARHCFAATYALDTTGDKLPDLEGPQTSPWCGSFGQPPPKLGAPAGITGTVP